MLTTDRINDICDGWAVPPVIVASLRKVDSDYRAWYAPRAPQYPHIRRHFPGDLILMRNRRERVTTCHELAHHIVYHMGYARWHLHTKTWERVFMQLLTEELGYSYSHARTLVRREISTHVVNEHPES